MLKKTPEQLIGMAEWPFVEWKKKKNRDRAVACAARLQQHGLSDKEISRFLTDLYRDAFDEAGHPGKFQTAEMRNRVNN